MIESKYKQDHNPETEQATEDQSDEELKMEYENDASLILDYELGEISRQYFTDEIDEVDGRIGAPRIISGSRLQHHVMKN